MPSILITGASSGIGKAAVERFLSEGWRVIATMRQPNPSLFGPHPNLTVLPCDVTDPDSIQACVSEALTQADQLDVLLNNAGYGLIGPMELATPAQIQRQFDTNVIGLIRMTQAVLPHMRQRHSGTLINVASIGGRTAFPLYSLYHGTKWAVEGLSESLSYELAQFNIKVKIVEPGPIKTAFYERSMSLTGQENAIANSEYARYAAEMLPRLARFGINAPGPEVVAETIWRAATDRKATLRYPVNTMGSLWCRRLFPEAFYRWFLQQIIRFY